MPETPSLKNAPLWGKLIKCSQPTTAIQLFKKIVDLWASAPAPAQKKLDWAMGCAFATLLSNLCRYKKYSLFLQLHLSQGRLKQLTLINHKSNHDRQKQIIGVNIMLQTAQFIGDLAWARFIYTLSLKTQTADTVTHGIVIRFLGKQKYFFEVLQAFDHLNAAPSPDKHDLTVAYGSMLHACYCCSEYDRGLAVYTMAEERGLLNAVIRTTLIRIAKLNHQPEKARQCLQEVLDDEHAAPETKKTARAYFDIEPPREDPVHPARIIHRNVGIIGDRRPLKWSARLFSQETNAYKRLNLTPVICPSPPSQGL